MFFSRDGVTFVQVDVINSTTDSATRNINLALFGSGPFTENAAIRFVASSLETGDSVNIDNLVINATGSLGVDTVNGGDGDDTIVWNANISGATDGRDVVNGGTEGALGDTFVINGNATAETFNIYTRAAWIALGGGRIAAATAEIVITRSTDTAAPTNANIIAELSEIEEIRVNSVDPSGASGAAGGDSFNIVGDFSQTSLRLNTITIDGEAGNDTIDISALSSAHRIVFKSNGGHDTIIGTLRDQDQIELADGTTMDDYTSSVDDDGFTTLTNGSHSIRYKAAGNGPQVGGDDQGDTQQPPVDDDPGNDGDEHEDEQDDDNHHGSDGDGHQGGSNQNGGNGPDVLRGNAGSNFLNGGGGRDIAFGGDGDDDVLGGGGADMLYGDGGKDRIFGQDGDDLIDAGAGDDQAQGGAGKDLFLASQGDGNDTYWGDELGGCGAAGSDTLDMAAITANITVDLGTGFEGRGSASSSQSGTDVLWGIENVVTGSGDDTIIASRAVNVMDGGSGEDTFRLPLRRRRQWRHHRRLPGRRQDRPLGHQCRIRQRQLHAGQRNRHRRAGIFEGQP